MDERKIRGEHRDVFAPDLVTRPNRYIWLGTEKLYDAFTFDFVRTEHGWRMNSIVLLTTCRLLQASCACSDVPRRRDPRRRRLSSMKTAATNDDPHTPPSL